MTTIGAALFDAVRDRWADQVGSKELEALEARLKQLDVPREPRADDLARPGD